MDKNEDGTVSAQEKLAYYTSHPVEKVKDEQASVNKSGYDKNGDTEETATAATVNVSA
jgi:hypothetical protein